MMSGYHKLKTACCVAVLTLGLAACGGGGNSDADLKAAADRARMEAEAAAAAAAAAAEAEKQAAVAAAEEAARLAAEAAEKMARATVQKNAIAAAIMAAQTAFDAVVLGASDAEIADADTKLQAAKDAITAAVDVDDTSMYTETVNGIESSLGTAKALVQQDRAAKKMARAEMQKSAIMTTTGAAEVAVALVVAGASNDVIAAAEAAVQVARDAIAAAVDVDDTSTYTETVDGIASSLTMAKGTVLAGRLQDRIDLQKGAIDTKIGEARSALAKVVLGASNMDISDAEMAVQAARDAIAAAVDVDDTSMYSAMVNGIESSLGTAETLVIADRASKKAGRAATQQTDIMAKITAAETALDAVDIEATNMEISDARDAVQAARDAIEAAVDIDDVTTYTVQINAIAGRLDTAEVAALSYRAIQQGDAIDLAVSDAQDAVEMVGPDADDDAVADAGTKVKALMTALDDAENLTEEQKADDRKTLEGLQDALADRKTLRMAIMDAMDALDELDNDSSDDAIGDVQDLIDDAQDAIDDAENLSDDEKAEFAAKIDDEDDGLQAMLDNKEKTIELARTGKTNTGKEDMARAEGLAMALDAAKATVAADGTFDDTAHMVFASDGDGVVAMHNGSKVTMTVTETGTPGNLRAGTFKMQDAGPASISGWTGQKFMRGEATDTTVEHLTVYTDIEAPEGMAFTAANLQNALGLETVPTVDTTGATPTYDLPSDNTDDVYKYITWGSAAKPSIVDKTDSDSLPDVDSRSFTGYLAGAMGKYSCTGDADACSMTFGEKNMIAALVGTWTFTADRGTKVKVPDSEYMHFGWWIDRPTKADSNGAYSYGFQTFAGGMQAYTASDLDAVTGTATYNGAAAGVYVTKDISGGQITGASMDEFTAAARLSANFGDGTNPGAINGSISGFKGADGSAMAGWGVTLDTVFLTTSQASFAGKTMGTTGPGATGTGSWEGMFYGDPPTATATGGPLGVAGRFDAHLPGTHIVGGFGATR